MNASTAPTATRDGLALVLAALREDNVAIAHLLRAVTTVEQAIRIRTGETGDDAL